MNRSILGKGFPLRAELHMHSSEVNPKAYGPFLRRRYGLQHISAARMRLEEYFSLRNRLFYAPFLFDTIMDATTICRTAAERGLKIIAITSHNSVEGYKDACRVNREESLGLIIVPGCEVSSSQGHILAYGARKSVEVGLSATETIHQIHKQGGIAVAAHPFMPLALRERVFELKLDGIEIFNSMAFERCNAQARAAAEKLGVPGTAGSDAHQKEEIGRSVTLFPRNVRDHLDVIDCIKAGRFEIRGAYTDMPRMIWRHVIGDIRLGFGLTKQ